MDVLRRHPLLTAVTASLLSLAQTSAETREYLALRVPLDPRANAWGVMVHKTDAGSSVATLSSLVRGEQQVGSLRSREFTAPPRLRFRLAGASHQKRNFVRLLAADGKTVLRSEPPPGVDVLKPYEWDLASVAGQAVRLELIDGDTGSGWAWLALGGLEPSVVAMPKAGEDVPADWQRVEVPPVEIRADGVPFLQSDSFRVDREGGSQQVVGLNVRATELYLLGGLNSVDEANPAWGGGDSFKNIFIGDHAGDLVLSYASGVRDRVPLVYGYTLWWRQPYRSNPAPFATDAKAREQLDRALCLANGIDGHKGDAPPCYMRIALRDEPLTAIAYEDDAAKVGQAIFEGVTFGGATDAAQLDAARFVRMNGGNTPAATKAWLDAHAIASADPYPASRRSAVEAVARMLYTYADDVTLATVARTIPDVDPTTFAGPRVRFEGSPEAAILTHVYFDNLAEQRTRVDATGIVHESNRTADNYGGFGTWKPALGPFWGSAYTRNRSLTVLGALGHEAEVERGLSFFDNWLMYFPCAWPQVQLGGKPVPGHAPVIANKPHVYFDELRHSGWPTKYKVRDFGNPENDGHGLLMLTRWRAWAKAGRPAEWVRARWRSLCEAAEYVPWALDHPDLSFSEHGLLYNESEGGMQIASLYCDTPCYLGLLAYAEMADAIGERKPAERWRQQAERLRAAMEAYYPKTADGGDVWDPAKSANWVYSQGTLAPLILGMDLHGFDVKNRLPAGWAARTERSYIAALKNMRPAWCAPAGLGYGQNYYAQAALLLDRMAEAEKVLDWLARACYAPRLAHPYRSPEGATVATDGSVWRRWGDLGNLYQMNEAIYTILAVCGIDDLDADVLTLMPRMPPGWTAMTIEDYPVRARSAGRSTRVPLSLTLRRQGNRTACQLRFANPVDAWRLRLGPFPASATRITVTCGGASVAMDPFESGDSKWTWLERKNSGDTSVTIEAKEE